MEERLYGPEWEGRQVRLTVETAQFEKGTILFINDVDTDDAYRPFLVSDKYEPGKPKGYWFTITTMEPVQTFYSNGNVLIDEDLVLYTSGLKLEGEVLDDLITVLMYLKMKEEGDGGKVLQAE